MYMSGRYHLTSQAGWNRCDLVYPSINLSNLSLTHVRMKLFAVVMVFYDVIAVDL